MADILRENSKENLLRASGVHAYWCRDLQRKRDGCWERLVEEATCKLHTFPYTSVLGNLRSTTMLRIRGNAS